MSVVDVINEQDHIATSEETIINWAQAALELLGFPEAQLSVVLTDNAEIQELNRDYLGRDKPTNVISFPLLEGEDCFGSHLGDIVISAERACEEAVDTDLSSLERLKQLLVHGICHLTGYNHEDVDEATAQKMEAKEAEILAALAAQA